MLRDFLSAHRGEILARARSRAAERNAPPPREPELTAGLPLFLEQLGEALRRSSAQEPLDEGEIEASAGRHGRALFEDGATAGQVVRDYADLGQAITSLAAAHRSAIDADESRMLNVCLDDAIAGAVTEYSRLREQTIAEAGTERLGFLAREMRNVTDSAILTFGSIQKGAVAAGGSAGVVHARSLLRLSGLIDRSLADVHLDSGVHNVERVAVREILEEVEVGAAMAARERGLTFEMTAVGDSVIVEADRQILAAAIANLVQNALKVTRPDTTVRLGASTAAERVLISVEDESGGLPPGRAEDFLRAVMQTNRDRTGLDLTLAICVKAAMAMAGELLVRDVPGKGSVFTLSLPKQDPPPSSVFGKPRKKPGGSPAASGAALGGVRSSWVLLVDDEPVVAAAHARRLWAPSRHVEICTSSVWALERITGGERFDLVICDGRMPNLRGVELYRRALVAWPGLRERIIFVSGGVPEEDARFIEEQRLPFFAKPVVRGDELEQAVDTIVARTRAA
jgi:signal transduction histidine kinase/CheY-like chemotaxis protein